MPDISKDITKAANDVANVAKDAAYVVIGAGVLGFQRAQVQRQELRKRLADPKAELEQRVADRPGRPGRHRPDHGRRVSRSCSTVWRT